MAQALESSGMADTAAKEQHSQISDSFVTMLSNGPTRYIHGTIPRLLERMNTAAQNPFLKMVTSNGETVILDAGFGCGLPQPGVTAFFAGHSQFDTGVRCEVRGYRVVEFLARYKRYL